MDYYVSGGAHCTLLLEVWQWGKALHVDTILCKNGNGGIRIRAYEVLYSHVIVGNDGIDLIEVGNLYSLFVRVKDLFRPWGGPNDKKVHNIRKT